MQLIGLFCILVFMHTCGYAAESNEKKPKIYVFIHACTLAHWHSILNKQLAKIEQSGLYDACEAILIGVLGEGDMSRWTRKYPKITLLFQDPNLGLYERPTLLELHRLCVSEPEALVLYVHTKGITRKGDQNVVDWVNLMEYFCINKWQECVAALIHQGYDVCGVNWRPIPSLHFSGNFWWAKAKYIGTLPGYIGSDYFDPEMWLGQNRPRACSFHESGVDHYFKAYPKSLYEK